MNEYKGAILLIEEEIKWKKSILKRTTKNKELQKVLEEYISNLQKAVERLSAEGEVIELCPECMAKHVIWLSEHGGIPI